MPNLTTLLNALADPTETEPRDWLQVTARDLRAAADNHFPLRIPSALADRKRLTCVLPTAPPPPSLRHAMRAGSGGYLALWRWSGVNGFDSCRRLGTPRA